MLRRAVLAAVVHAQHAVPARSEAVHERGVEGTARLKQNEDDGEVLLPRRQEVLRINFHPFGAGFAPEKTDLAADGALRLAFGKQFRFQGERVVKVLP